MQELQQMSTWKFHFTHCSESPLPPMSSVRKWHFLLFYRFPQIARYEITPNYVSKNWVYGKSDGDICSWWFIAVFFVGFPSTQTIYVTRPHESNLPESPKWVGLQNMFCIGISHCQCTLSVLMYWLWEGECPITGVYSSHKARQIDIEGCPLLPADLALRPTITMNMLPFGRLPWLA